MSNEKVDIQLRFEKIFGKQDVSNLPVLRNENTLKDYEFEEINYDEQHG